MIKESIHSCSFYCDYPECIKAQRDAMRDKYVVNDSLGKHYDMGWNSALDEAAARINNIRGFGQTTQDSFALFITGLKK